MSAPLTFGSSGNPFDDTRLSGYDSAPGNDGFDLTGFDQADGKTVLAPAGVCTCRIERGELVKTKAGGNAYRLCFKTVEPSESAGFTIWHYINFGDKAKDNAAKLALAPLGLTTSAALRAPFPPVGKDVFVTALVVISPPKNGYPASNGIQRFEPCAPPASAVAAPNPFAVPLDAPGTTGEGGKPQ